LCFHLKFARRRRHAHVFPYGAGAWHSVRCCTPIHGAAITVRGIYWPPLLVLRSERSHAFTAFALHSALYRIVIQKFASDQCSNKYENCASMQVIAKENSARLLEKFERVSDLWMLHQKVTLQRFLEFLIQIYRYCCHPPKLGVNICLKVVSDSRN